MSGALERFKHQMAKSGGGNKPAQFAGEAANAGVALGHTMVQQAVGGVLTAIGVQQPRDFIAAMEKISEEAQLVPESLKYRWTVRNRDGTKGEVAGLSIEAAMLIARNYGNCATWAEIVGETDTHWVINGYFLDRESGFLSIRQKRQRKPVQGKGRMTQDRQEDADFGAGQSKAIRDATLRAVPEALKKLLDDIADKGTARQMTKGGKAAGVDKVKKAFAGMDVKLSDLERRVGKKSKDWSAEDLATLRQIWTAISEGHTTAADEFELHERAKGDLANGVQSRAEEPALEPPTEDAPPEPPPHDDPPEDI